MRLISVKGAHNLPSEPGSPAGPGGPGTGARARVGSGATEKQTQIYLLRSDSLFLYDTTLYRYMQYIQYIDTDYYQTNTCRC